MALPRIHATAIVEENVTIGEGTVLWDGVHVRHGTVIGRDCIVGEKTYVAYDVRIGDLVKINAHVSICTGVVIEDGCMIASHVVFTNDLHPRAADPDITRLLPSGPTRATRRCLVRRGATIGANATIGPGVTLGEFCMVGMGAVVTSDVIPHGLVLGNPARLTGLVARDGTPVLRLRSGERLPAGARIPCPGDGYLEVRGGAAVVWVPD